jgi:hypothetical protein
MAKIINVIGDLHNFDSTKKILKNFDNVICLGDIGAAIETEELFQNNGFTRYRKCYFAFAKKDFSSITEEDKNWYIRVNVNGWKKQLDSIKSSKREVTVIMGNSDKYMIDFFPECAKYLKESLKNEKFKFIDKPELMNMGNIQLVFFPYSTAPIDISYILNKINLKKPLFVFSHCPAFKESRKNYYMHCYAALEQISNTYSGNIFYIHGHVHPSESYNYTLSELKNVIFLTPKAEENSKGINVDHDVIQISEDASIGLVDSTSKKHPRNFKQLPEKYYKNEDHWNEWKPE